MNAPTLRPDITFDLITSADLAADAPAAIDWLWYGYLAGGRVTLLTGPWKCGKTTLVSVLLARMGAGGALAGRAVRAGSAVVLSEEDKALWADRARRLGIGPHVGLLSRPFRGARPDPDQWQALIDHLAAHHRARGLDLVVVDSLASFFPGRTESDAGTILDMLRPLRDLTAAGVAVLILHHPRRARAPAGQTARGSRALGESMDILMEMGRLSGPVADDRRRRLAAFSRHPDTPRRLVIELNADGTDYAALGGDTTAEFDDGRQVLLWVLADAAGKLTRAELLEGWPADYKKPDAATLWRWLDRAVDDGRVMASGTGRANNPFRYWLAANVEKWARPYELPELPPLEGVFGLTPPTPKPPRKAKAKGGGGPGPAGSGVL
jgi:hypothetical protein